MIMATIKSYTDLQQSKKLAEILPIESADMFYNEEPDETYPKDIVDTKYPMIIREGQKHYLEEYGIPCWSLAALLGVLPILERKGYQKAKPRLLYNVAINKWIVDSHVYTTDAYDNPVDACVEMIEKLHELKML